MILSGSTRFCSNTDSQCSGTDSKDIFSDRRHKAGEPKSTSPTAAAAKKPINKNHFAAGGADSLLIFMQTLFKFIDE